MGLVAAAAGDEESGIATMVIWREMLLLLFLDRDAC